MNVKLLVSLNLFTPGKFLNNQQLALFEALSDINRYLYFFINYSIKFVFFFRTIRKICWRFFEFTERFWFSQIELSKWEKILGSVVEDRWRHHRYYNRLVCSSWYNRTLPGCDRNDRGLILKSEIHHGENMDREHSFCESKIHRSL